MAKPESKMARAKRLGFNSALIAQLKTKLESNGWVNILTAMVDSPENDEFGTLYKKNGERFWFNINTFQNLPVD